MQTDESLLHRIAVELGCRPAQVRAAVELLDGGSSVPFIARYRKEATEGLDDVQLRALESRLAYLRELHERREAVRRSIEEQGKLTPALRAALDAAPTKQELEDLYLPFKPRRRTKAMIAREAGLEPLAERLVADLSLEPLAQAGAFAGVYAGGAEALAALGFADAASLLDGVRDILAERWSEDAALVQSLRSWLWQEGLLRARLNPARNPLDPEVAKFRNYFEYDEPIRRVPSHRALAVFRGRALEVLDARLAPPEDAAKVGAAETRIALHLGWSPGRRPGDELMRKCVAWCWKVKLSLSLERDLFARLRGDAEQVAIRVFAENLRDLLLAAPAGKRVVMGLDPGIRTGVKVAVVSATGKLLDTATVYPHEPRRDWEGALHTLLRLCEAHRVDLLAIGNGTASRETDTLALELIRRVQQRSPEVAMDRVVVSEAGASVYSASEFASKEMPDLDVSLRGAVSIARRLQDPLAELVKIDPKSIGVGQYQHDVDQGELARTLGAVVEDCVHSVGVDLNTASAPLLSRVSGISGAVAGGIVRWRDAHGAFSNRRQLREVPGLGEKSFEQSAGFLRIRDGDNPLDRSAVHPETYPLVAKILQRLALPIDAVMGRPEVLRSVVPSTLADEGFGAITVGDVLAELEKPGRDPRPDFKVARFNEGVESMADLRPGMRLGGTVSNVAAFGAFVDLGVHQDGLVHVSQLADRFVADAREVVKAGDAVEVRVLEVDAARGRISLTMRREERLPSPAPDASGPTSPSRPRASGRRAGTERALATSAPAANAMAAAFEKLRSGG